MSIIKPLDGTLLSWETFPDEDAAYVQIAGNGNGPTMIRFSSDDLANLVEAAKSLNPRALLRLVTDPDDN